MYLFETPLTDNPEEYLPEGWQELIPRKHDVTDEALVVNEVLRYVRSRLQLIIDRAQQPPVLMLSGGIDSILIAAVLSELEPASAAITFHSPNSADTQIEVDNAAQVANFFGLEHYVLAPSDEEYRADIRSVVQRLETTEPWEVLAGYIYFSVDQFCLRRNLTGPLISGAGADVLTLGGKDFVPREHDEETVNAWASEVQSEIARTFTENRFIPDFYDRLLCRPENHYKVWQTTAAVELARRLHPAAVRGQKMDLDKKVFRTAAAKLGVPEEYCFTPKSPMQVSSGGLAGLISAARNSLSEHYGAQTYSDPLTEPLEFTVARYYLQTLQNEHCEKDSQK